MPSASAIGMPQLPARIRLSLSAQAELVRPPLNVARFRVAVGLLDDLHDPAVHRARRRLDRARLSCGAGTTQAAGARRRCASADRPRTGGAAPDTITTRRPPPGGRR